MQSPKLKLGSQMVLAIFHDGVRRRWFKMFVVWRKDTYTGGCKVHVAISRWDVGSSRLSCPAPIIIDVMLRSGACIIAFLIVPVLPTLILSLGQSELVGRLFAHFVAKIVSFTSFI